MILTKRIYKTLFTVQNTTVKFDNSYLIRSQFGAVEYSQVHVRSPTTSKMLYRRLRRYRVDISNHVKKNDPRSEVCKDVSREVVYRPKIQHDIAIAQRIFK